MVLLYRFDLAPNPGLDPGKEALPLLRDPPAGVARLLHRDARTATFLYETGDARLLSELLADARAQQLPGSPLAALQLLRQVAPLLDVAAEAGDPYGLRGHGGLNPWRLLVRPDDGEVTLLGYGLPSVEVLEWAGDERATDERPGPGLPYVPPEVLATRDSGVPSDLYRLGMVAAEVALGERLLQGRDADIEGYIRDGRAMYELERRAPPKALLHVLERLLQEAPEDRPQTGAEVRGDAEAALRDLQGVGLSLAQLAKVGVAELDLLDLLRGDEDAPTQRFADYEPEVAEGRLETATRPVPAHNLDLEADRTPTDVDAEVEEGPEVDSDDLQVEPAQPSPPIARPQSREDRFAALEQELAQTEHEWEAQRGTEPGGLPAHMAGMLRDLEDVVDEEQHVVPDSDAEPLEDERDELGAVEDSGAPPPAPEPTGEAAVPFRPAPEGADPSPARRIWPEAPDLLLFSTVTVDLDKRIALRGSRVEELTDLQVRALAYLARERHRAVPATELVSAIEHRAASAASMSSMVTFLRSRIEEDPAEPVHLKDGRLTGSYQLVQFEEAQREPEPLTRPEIEIHGRQPELERLLDMLRNHRAKVVTVAGTFGSGASAVAREAAFLLQAYEGWQVLYARIQGEHRFAADLARQLKRRTLGRPNVELQREVGEALARTDHLLVFLDVPEPHGAVQPVVAGWLKMRPRTPILVAGQGAIGLDDEDEFVLPLHGLPQAEAELILVERIRKHRPGAKLDAPVITDLVRSLDRMPLYLEQAARRTASQPPEAVRDQIRNGSLDLELGPPFDGGLQTNLARTLDRLPDPVQRALAHLVAFAGSFDLEAAEAVVALPEQYPLAVPPLLEALETGFLLERVEPEADLPLRWRLLETFRQHLARNANVREQDAAVRRHSDYYCRLGLEHGHGPWVEARARRLLTLERDNLSAVIARGGPRAAGAALGLTAMLGRESATELVEPVEPLAVEAGVSRGGRPEVRAQHAAALVAAARLKVFLGQGKGVRDTLDAAIEAASRLPPSEAARTLLDIGWMNLELKASTGVGFDLDKVARTDPWVVAASALLRGREQYAKVKQSSPPGDPSLARRAMTSAQHAFTEIGAHVGSAIAQRYLAEVLAESGEAPAAVSKLQAALATFLGVQDTQAVLECQIRLAELQVGMGLVPEAHEPLTEVLLAAKESSAQGLLALARGIQAAVYCLASPPRYEEAERFFFLALAADSPHQPKIQALFAVYQLLTGHPEAARAEARGAIGDPVARGTLALLERRKLTDRRDPEESILLFEALEAWRAGASRDRVEARLATRSSIAVRMVLHAPARARPGPR